jgi:protein O-mannosyl-transferase
VSSQRAGLRARSRSTARAPKHARVTWLASSLVVAGLAAYINSFAVPFVFDDHGSIVENAYIRQLWPLEGALSAPVQSAVAGRPFVSLSLTLNYALTGLSPAGFRGWNLVVHLLTGLVLFGVVRRTLTAPSLTTRFGAHADLLAWATALIWLVHPLNSEVIDYVIQRTESMMGLFYLLTLYAAVRAMSDTGVSARRWHAYAIACSALGMATKESMVTAPVMVLLYDAVFWAGGIGRALRVRWQLYSGLAATWAVLIALIVTGPRSHSAGFSSGVTPWTYLLNQPAMILRYVKLAVWPQGLVLDYGIPLAVVLRDVWLSAIVVLACLAGTVVAWFKRPTLAFLGTWFFVTLAPSSSIIPIATEVGAERRMYLPLMALVAGVVMTSAVVMTRVSARAEPRRRTQVMTVCVAALCCALMVLTLQRNREYSSATGIWQSVLDRRPTGRAHYNLAIELKEQGQRSEALRQYQLALADEPAAHYAIGFELDADGKYEDAIAHYREYIRLRPNDINVIRADVLLGRALTNTDHFQAAADAFQQALERQPSNVDARAGLADALLKDERYDAAIPAYAEYVRRQPNDARAHSGLGIALVGRERFNEAVPEFARAVDLEPGDARNHYNLGNVLASTGRLEEAVSCYQRGLALAPNDVSLHNALALVFAARGQSDDALAQFRQSLALDPSNAQTRRDIAVAFPDQRSHDETR